MSMRRAELEVQRVEFVGGQGHPVVGRLERPRTPVIPGCIVLASCFSCTKELKGGKRVAQALTAQGLSVLRFDYSGLGESRGDFADTTFETKVADVVAAAEWADRHAEPVRALAGHSIGGTACIGAAQFVRGCPVVATINSPAETTHLGELIRDRAPQIDRGEVAELEFMGGRAVRVSKTLADDLKSQDIDSRIRALACPLLVFQALADELLDARHAERLFALAPQPKAFIPLPGADHLLLRNPQDAELVGRTLAGWILATTSDMTDS